MGASQIAADFHGQLTVLYAVLHLAPLAGFSTSAFLVFTLAWLLNDLASPLCLLESGRSFNNNLKTSSQDRLLTFSAIIRAFISSQTSSLFNLNKGLSFDLNLSSINSIHPSGLKLFKTAQDHLEPSKFWAKITTNNHLKPSAWMAIGFT